eukprot:s848_g7.t1
MPSTGYLMSTSKDQSPFQYWLPLEDIDALCRNGSTVIKRSVWSAYTPWIASTSDKMKFRAVFAILSFLSTGHARDQVEVTAVGAVQPHLHAHTVMRSEGHPSSLVGIRAHERAEGEPETAETTVTTVAAETTAATTGAETTAGATVAPTTGAPTTAATTTTTTTTEKVELDSDGSRKPTTRTIVVTNIEVQTATVVFTEQPSTTTSTTSTSTTNTTTTTTELKASSSRCGMGALGLLMALKLFAFPACLTFQT